MLWGQCAPWLRREKEGGERKREREKKKKHFSSNSLCVPQSSQINEKGKCFLGARSISFQCPQFSYFQQCQPQYIKPLSPLFPLANYVFRNVTPCLTPTLQQNPAPQRANPSIISLFLSSRVGTGVNYAFHNLGGTALLGRAPLPPTLPSPLPNSPSCPGLCTRPSALCTRLLDLI